MYFGNQPYGLEDRIKYHGDGSNMYRGEDFGQPRTLHDGDVLANGLVVVGEPFVGYNSSAGLRFSDGTQRLFPSRIPLQLKSDKPGVYPAELVAGHILQTGCVVLDEPKWIGPVEWHDDQEEVGLMLTGGRDGHNVGVPSDIPLAVFDEVYPPRTNTLLGAFALEGALAMDESARRNLLRLGQLTLDIDIS